jgi:diadenosine tetraphosphate (Ap4A) HIT family hydrolase
LLAPEALGKPLDAGIHTGRYDARTMPTPDRQMAGCVFCAIVSGAAPATFLHSDDLVVAFMDIRPVQVGHLLVVPRAHAKLIPELDDAILARMWSVATVINRALRASPLPVEAVSVYVADGDAAGQEVAHMHIHLIPRHTRDGFGFRFPPGYGAQPERTDLEDTAAKIRAGIPAAEAPEASGD